MSRARHRKSASRAFDAAGIHAAMLRASRAARRLAEETGTPFYVWIDGRIVDLNAGASKRRQRARRPRAK